VRMRSVPIGAVALAALCLSGCRPPPSAVPSSPPSRAAAWPATFTDAQGESATLPGPPARIVSLSPAITEILFAVGAGSRVVGVTSYCDFPPEAARLPKVGSYTGLSVEKVIGLRPDIVIGMRGNAPEALGALRRAGLKVLAYDPITLYGVLELMDEIGHMTQETPGNVPAVAELRARVDAVRSRAALLRRRPRTLVAVQLEPLYAAGAGTHCDDMVRLAGGENLAADADVPWPQYSLERMLEKDPEAIITVSGHINGEEMTSAKVLSDLRKSRAWSGTTAVKRGNVLTMDDDLLTLPGPRIVDGLETMARAIARAAQPAGGGNG
jgi:cobalamin transport system substrate-binding protein